MFSKKRKQKFQKMWFVIFENLPTLSVSAIKSQREHNCAWKKLLNIFLENTQNEENDDNNSTTDSTIAALPENTFVSGNCYDNRINFWGTDKGQIFKHIGDDNNKENCKEYCKAQSNYLYLALQEQMTKFSEN